MRIHNDVNTKDPKALAKSLRTALAARSVSLSHSECLEIVARQFGWADWNTFAAKLAMDASHIAGSPHAEINSQSSKAKSAARISPPVAPEQLSCSFCGKSQQEVRGLIEGGCGNRGASPCVFICDECVTFGAQVVAEAASGAVPSAPDPACRSPE